jgi:muramoyltetrapeptide carboxypeptidase
MSEPFRIGVVAPASRIDPALAEDVQALARRAFPAKSLEIVFDSQCFLSSGHFAGDDAARAGAFVRVANDPAFDALWVARGGYGAARLIADVLPRLNEAARAKSYLGYSDAGALLGALFGVGFAHVAHGPVPADLLRAGGEAAVERALGWFLTGDRAGLEPTVLEGTPCAAFNLTILGTLVGTPWQPDLSGHVLMLEEVSEHMYRIDRALRHILANPGVRAVAGIKLGRCSLIPPNEPDFGQDEAQVAQQACADAGVPWLGRADIGHDIDNKIVPFGRLADERQR